MIWNLIGTIEGKAAFWKQHYNTPLGAGTLSKYAFKVQKVLGLTEPIAGVARPQTRRQWLDGSAISIYY